jgi:hypothetical protein
LKSVKVIGRVCEVIHSFSHQLDTLLNKGLSGSQNHPEDVHIEYPPNFFSVFENQFHLGIQIYHISSRGEVEEPFDSREHEVNPFSGEFLELDALLR